MTYTQESRARQIRYELDRKIAWIDRITSSDTVTDEQHRTARQIELEMRPLQAELNQLEGRNAPPKQTRRELTVREVDRVKQILKRKSTPDDIYKLAEDVLQRPGCWVTEAQAFKLGVGR
jgi:hypothetical protein